MVLTANTRWRCPKHATLEKQLPGPALKEDEDRKVPCSKKSKMSALDVDDFIQQNRAVSDQVETHRGYWESDKHWLPRREFILRNMSEYDLEQLDQLLALSMVWANNVFLGCRYSTELLDKVKEMAEGIEVEDAPVFKTRDEIMKKQQGR
ncbi:CDKN2AIP N-terminal-like protein [Scophthalmus maximus]|uniref:CDKN2AIP N-terminal-like protein n=1 Tax=Scophthalmus maximus TaxID=52904 RepID=UPI001FA92053|nr:CDKN2AIP N-terminal-like protein [Scophthalmus maximus]